MWSTAQQHTILHSPISRASNVFYKWQRMTQPHAVQCVFIGRAHLVFYNQLYV